MERVGKEVGCDKGKDAFSDVVVIAEAAAGGVGRSRRCGAGRVIGCVHNVGVGTELVMKGLARGDKSDGEVLGLAVAAGEGKAQIQTALPFLQDAGVQSLFVRRLRLIAA